MYLYAYVVIEIASTIIIAFPTSSTLVIIPTITGTSQESDGLSGSEIAGIVIGSIFAGVILLAGILIIAIWYVCMFVYVNVCVHVFVAIKCSINYKFSSCCTGG